MLSRLVLFLAMSAICLSLAGCAGSERESDPNQVSAIPWNRPQQWEGPGTLGGFNPQVQY
jgi:hypothetical protein